MKRGTGMAEKAVRKADLQPLKKLETVFIGVIVRLARVWHGRLLPLEPIQEFSPLKD
jgi:hypothetical protein